MRGLWQAAAFLATAIACSGAENKGFAWEPPRSEAGVYTADLGMLDAERDEYATNMASYASNQVITAQASPDSLKAARRLLGLALQISPRNKRAVVVCFQLAKGVMPEAQPGEYGAQAFARLLLSRGQLLAKQGGDQNLRLARCFIQLAAEIDPKNEDAVYAAEIQRLDHGELDWTSVTDAPAKKP